MVSGFSQLIWNVRVSLSYIDESLVKSKLPSPLCIAVRPSVHQTRVSFSTSALFRAKLFSDLPLPIHHHHHHHHHRREREREDGGVCEDSAVDAVLGLRQSGLGSPAHARLRRRLAPHGHHGTHFVPNLTMGAPVIKSLRKHTNAYLDCHLMVTNPLDYVEPLGDAGASGFTFHVEVSRENWPELVKKIKSKGMRPGVSLRPGTPIEEVYPLVEGENPVEMVLVMTVEPGFGGQKFMPEMMEKVRVLRAKYPSLDIEVDGGLGPSTIDMAASAGANCIVAGSSVFGSPEPAQVILHMRKSVEDVQNSN
ncbi:hypothetical protein EUGRSUZ_I01657 [Eucalyptus grandis]|uniref:Uncharacterized protein n=2 Tax=Eucalyptus grandis TaxID=71139 RepID=A0ACC3JG33_EUCGR|nr:hypothetical protein EUGRSUZ_I01657 [Eucalyptus grandis]